MIKSLDSSYQILLRQKINSEDNFSQSYGLSVNHEKDYDLGIKNIEI